MKNKNYELEHKKTISIGRGYLNLCMSSHSLHLMNGMRQLVEALSKNLPLTEKFHLRVLSALIGFGKVEYTIYRFVGHICGIFPGYLGKKMGICTEKSCVESVSGLEKELCQLKYISGEKIE